MPSKHANIANAMPLELMRSAPVAKILVTPPALPDARTAERFEVERAASNALDQLPPGYIAIEVRVVARKVNKGHKP